MHLSALATAGLLTVTPFVAVTQSTRALWPDMAASAFAAIIALGALCSLIAFAGLSFGFGQGLSTQAQAIEQAMVEIERLRKLLAMRSGK